jgi:TetR/AcrR family transcriptional repressor of nem operon
MPRHAPDRHATTHAALVAAASELVRDHGFDGLTVGAVMKAAGLTHGGFYAHFPDRAALVQAAVVHALGPTIARFAEFAQDAERAGDPAAVARTYLSEGHVARRAQGCAVAALVGEAARQPLPVRTAFAEGAATAAGLLAQAVPPDDGSARAWGVFAMMSGALALMRTVPDPALRAEIRARVEADLRRLAAP